MLPPLSRATLCRGGAQPPSPRSAATKQIGGRCAGQSARASRESSGGSCLAFLAGSHPIIPLFPPPSLAFAALLEKSDRDTQNFWAPQRLGDALKT